MYDKNRDHKLKLGTALIVFVTICCIGFSARAEDLRITTIQFVGNTAFTSEDLLNRLNSRIGGEFDSVATPVGDASILEQIYQKNGYELANAPKATFSNGMYSIALSETRIAGYRFDWRGEHTSTERSLLRELPSIGQLKNKFQLEASLQRLRALGVFESVELVLAPSNEAHPEQLEYIVEVSEKPGWFIGPSSSRTDVLSGDWNLGFDAGYNNLFGEQQRLNLQFLVVPTVTESWLAFGLQYSVPWLDFDVLDFKTNKTSFSIQINRYPHWHQELLSNTLSFERSYTYADTRSSLELGVGRAIAEDLNLGVRYTYRVSENTTEPLPTNAPLADATLVKSLIPATSWTSQAVISLNATPKTGPVQINAEVGYGFGQQGNRNLSWGQLEAGIRGKFGFGFTAEKPFSTSEDLDVTLAYRTNFGINFGDAPSWRAFTPNAKESSERSFLRGFGTRELSGDTIWLNSLELRWHTGLSLGIVSNTTLLVFSDFGNIWGGPSAYRVPLASGPLPDFVFGIGAGVVLDFQFGPLSFPLQFSIAGNPWTPGLQFSIARGYRF
jgi:outer membrane protein insertion porin family